MLTYPPTYGVFDVIYIGKLLNPALLGEVFEILDLNLKERGDYGLFFFLLHGAKRLLL